MEMSNDTLLLWENMTDVENDQSKIVLNALDNSTRHQGLNLTEEELDEICGKPLSNDHTFENMRFISSGILVCVVGSFGLIGNFLTCFTLKTMSRTMTLFNKLLLTLALIDIIFIMAGGAFMTQNAFQYESVVYTAIFPFLTYPMAGLSMTGSTYMCVAISVERYLGICHRNVKIHRKFRFYLIGIILLTVAIESPRFFELEGVNKNGKYSIRYAKHRWSASYVTYYCMWFRLFATALLPLASLIYFNAKIVMYYRDNNFTRAYTTMRKLNKNDKVKASTTVKVQEEEPEVKPLAETVDNKYSQTEVGENEIVTLPPATRKITVSSNNSRRTTGRHKTSRERSLFIMLCCITLTFCICHLPRLCINVYEFYNQESIIICVNNLNRSWKLPRWGSFANEVSNCLLIINSSANFVYYCWVGKSFRQSFFKMSKKYLRRVCAILPCQFDESVPVSPRPMEMATAVNGHRFDIQMTQVGREGDIELINNSTLNNKTLHVPQDISVDNHV